MYVRFFFATLINLLFTLLAYVAAPFVAPFSSGTGQLPKLLAWFGTEDAPLDAGWSGGYFTNSSAAWYLRPFVYSGTGTPTGFNLYWLRVRWLWRNPAYGFCVAIGIAYDPADWTINHLTTDGTNITFLWATTKDGRFFCYTTSSGWKLGYKLWWAFDANFALLPTVPASKNTGNKLPLCFTPEI